MKVEDLIDKTQMDLAYEAGRQLAKMVNNINLAPKQRTKKSTFGAFFQTTIPQPLQENSNELNSLDARQSSQLKQRSYSHQLNLLIHKLKNMNNKK